MITIGSKIKHKNGRTIMMMRKGIVFLIILLQVLWGQWFKRPEMPTLDDFIADTLQINIPADSLTSGNSTPLRVLDRRDHDGRILDIQQTEKYKVIPVDQYLALERPLAELFTEQFTRDSLDFSGTLKITRLHVWYDDGPVFAKGRRLNAYTILYDDKENPVSDWLWEISVPKIRREKEADQIGRMVTQWMESQSRAIQNRSFHRRLFPYLYRRQLIPWTDFIFLADGFAVNAHLTLDFPPGREKTWNRGAPGIYYRQARHHESIAIGGLDQQWFRRIHPRWILHYAVTGRMGFNSFDRDYYSQLDYWNIVFLNLSSSAALEYRPVFHQGIYGGIGVFNSFSLLPLVIDRYELGISVTLGVVLP
ncbi:MAG: hypothetical protein ACE5D1_07810 [Fidelibacterota bacterium]